jgi:hypothetical protein
MTPAEKALIEANAHEMRIIANGYNGGTAIAVYFATLAPHFRADQVFEIHIHHAHLPNPAFRKNTTGMNVRWRGEVAAAAQNFDGSYASSNLYKNCREYHTPHESDLLNTYGTLN